MKKIVFLFLLLALALLVVGCTRNYAQPTGYATAPQQLPQQNPYYGGGCGVSAADVAENPVEASVVSPNL